MSGSQGFRALCENPTGVFLDVSKLLITYADNILRNPNEEKYRSIRIGNPTFSTKLLPVKGAVECLFEMGFKEAETHLLFPKSASVERLRQVRETIVAERDQRLGASKVASNPQSARVVPNPAPVPPSTPAGWVSAAAPPMPAPDSLPFTESSVSFLRTMQSNFQHVMIYESPELQQKALSCIPHELLKSRAKERLKQAKDVDPECSLGEEDMLVLDLLQWFKMDFFSWVDSLPCSRCGGRTQPSGSLPPSNDDLHWDAGRVENHYCQTCHLSTRFPRYNHPEKLLESRRGRCGEWANCFTLCCRALGLEARYIWDSTDHVWTEVFSNSQHRWLHCDPCENACDKPLLYEVGWGKKLSYILAFSKDQVMDVTWRYSCKHPEVLSRRTQIQEKWLLHTLNGLNTTRQQSLGPERKKELMQRLLVELVEFISPKTPKSGELGGRISGSLAWRAARGETGASDAKGDAEECVFIPSESEKQTKLFHICYNVAKDCYLRVSNGQETLSGWQRGAWRKENVFRKEEHDWQMVYLARTEGSSSGRISWKLDCAPAGMKIKTASVKAFSQTFHSGHVRWSLSSAQTTIEFPGDGELHSAASLSGGTELIVEAELTGGEGDVSSWQHAQLFRQSLKETETVLFELQVKMEQM
ncbi:peptide-N(4)-(N-acetyl-beta-glucosaminyl)asparagine amidase-like isoform X2 [Myxocyprinus asiaticus]|uniref:peptide-N(4)-(N-acetyl-beta- glucosaminyl)asparagine amidase-like isoform X2 n=1 Tax=Myxocyprinus asiaticus TaxID=70543 RepID=UPI0022229F60|nr:peptide-N(4)-(N-acetyl-beta-glucosaminyl)asparagine amidase-like isoform X2 [Myxocyprinus asiaticus]